MKNLASGKLIRLHPMIDKKMLFNHYKKKVTKIVEKNLSELLCFEDLASNPKQCSIGHTPSMASHFHRIESCQLVKSKLQNSKKCHWRNGGDLSRQEKALEI